MVARSLLIPCETNLKATVMPGKVGYYFYQGLWNAFPDFTFTQMAFLLLLCFKLDKFYPRANTNLAPPLFQILNFSNSDDNCTYEIGQFLPFCATFFPAFSPCNSAPEPF